MYSPETSGVFWEEQDVPLDDIDHIEITRGPGGTVWGANAVNGVISIITKRADGTPGFRVGAGGGSQGKAEGLVQYGGTAGQTGSYRVFGDYSNQGNLTASDGHSPAADGWNMMHGGFRSDWNLSPADSLTVQGDLLRTGEGQTISTVFSSQLPLEGVINDLVTVGEGNILARWNHKLANGSDTSLQVYFDRNNRDDAATRVVFNTVDIDFQHHLKLGSHSDIVWGAGFRVNADTSTAGYAITWVPVRRTDLLFSTFIQDEIALGHSVWLTAGSKVEHNAYTGFVLEPAVKLLWQTTERQTLWISTAQAVIQSSRVAADMVADAYVFPVPGGGFGVGQLTGSPTDRRIETLRDAEAGYRAQVTGTFSVDIATFSSYYNHLNDTVPGTPFFTTDEGPPHLVLPLVFENVANANTYGAEVSGTWQATSRWKLSPGVTAMHLTASNEDGGIVVTQNEDATPQFQAQLRSSVDLTKHLDWDVEAWHVGHLRDGGVGSVPAYNRVDTRLGWRIGRSAEISVVGQNLLTPLHAEFDN